MNGSVLLASLRGAGVVLERDGDDLIVTTRPDVKIATFRDEISRHKPALLDALDARDRLRHRDQPFVHVNSDADLDNLVARVISLPPAEVEQWRQDVATAPDDDPDIALDRRILALVDAWLAEQRAFPADACKVERAANDNPERVNGAA